MAYSWLWQWCWVEGDRMFQPQILTGLKVCSGWGFLLGTVYAGKIQSYTVTRCHQPSQWNYRNPALKPNSRKGSRVPGFCSVPVFWLGNHRRKHSQRQRWFQPNRHWCWECIIFGLNDIDVTVVSRGSHHIFYRESSHVFSMMPSMLLGLLHQGSNASQALQLAWDVVRQGGHMGLQSWHENSAHIMSNYICARLACSNKCARDARQLETPWYCPYVFFWAKYVTDIKEGYLYILYSKKTGLGCLSWFLLLCFSCFSLFCFRAFPLVAKILLFCFSAFLRFFCCHAFLLLCKLFFTRIQVTWQLETTGES